jgi:hypothetical protein
VGMLGLGTTAGPRGGGGGGGGASRWATRYRAVPCSSRSSSADPARALYVYMGGVSAGRAAGGWAPRVTCLWVQQRLGTQTRGAGRCAAAAMPSASAPPLLLHVTGTHCSQAGGVCTHDNKLPRWHRVCMPGRPGAAARRRTRCRQRRAAHTRPAAPQPRARQDHETVATTVGGASGRWDAADTCKGDVGWCSQRELAGQVQLLIRCARGSLGGVSGCI